MNSMIDMNGVAGASSSILLMSPPLSLGGGGSAGTVGILSAGSSAARRQAENTGRWSKAEHSTFLEGLAIHGKEWKKVAQMVKTRTVVQTRTHAQKYFQKMAKASSDGGDDDDDGGANADEKGGGGAPPTKKAKTGASGAVKAIIGTVGKCGGGGSAGGGTGKKPARPRLCRRCHNHGIQVPVKGHVACPKAMCTCHKCGSVEGRGGRGGSVKGMPPPLEGGDAGPAGRRARALFPGAGGADPDTTPQRKRRGGPLGGGKSGRKRSNLSIINPEQLSIETNPDTLLFGEGGGEGRGRGGGGGGGGGGGRSERRLRGRRGQRRWTNCLWRARPACGGTGGCPAAA